LTCGSSRRPTQAAFAPAPPAGAGRRSLRQL
jgi:hypothetical protein